MSYGVFSEDMIQQYIDTAIERNDAVFAALSLVFRTQFENTIPDNEERKSFVNRLNKFVKLYNFFAQFIKISLNLERFAFIRRPHCR